MHVHMHMPTTQRRTGAAWLSAGCIALMAGCATPVAPPVPPRPAPGPAVAIDPVTVWAREQQRRARELEAREQFAPALLLWDGLVLLDPTDAEAAAERERLQATIAQRVTDLLRRARLAERKPDPAGASAEQLYLSVLALQPRQVEAARALRSLELRRVPRGSSLPSGATPILPTAPPPSP